MLLMLLMNIVEMFKVFLTAYNGKCASLIRNERKKNNKMKRSRHFSVAIKQESLFSITWNITTFKLLMNQFHSSKKFLTADIVAFVVMVH